MEQYLTDITDYLWSQSWQIGLLIFLVAGGCWLLRNASAHWRYLLWCVVLAKCLVPPLLTLPVAILPVADEPIASISSETIGHNPEINRAVEPAEFFIMPSETVGQSGGVEMSNSKDMGQVGRVDWWVSIDSRAWLGMGWLIGILLFGLAAMIRAVSFGRWLGVRRKPVAAELLAEVGGLKEELGLKRLPRLWEIDGISQPFVWGWWRGAVYIPVGFWRNCSVRQRRDILVHELMHVMRGDALVNFLQFIAQGMFFFHPLVWWSNLKLKQEREKCCDETTIALLGSCPQDYGGAIVVSLLHEYEEKKRVPSLAIAGSVKNIEERIKAIMKPGREFLRRPSWTTVMIVLLLALIIVPSALVVTSRGQEKTEPDVQTILEKVRLAYRPTENMRIELIRESPSTQTRYVLGTVRPTGPPPRISNKYTIVLNGRRSRIDNRQEYFNTPGSQEPDRIRWASYIYDGFKQIDLDEYIKTSNSRARGHVSLGFREYNSQLLSKLLLTGLRPPIYSERILKDYDLSLSKGDDSGIYILEAIAPVSQHETKYRVMIDSNRGYNITQCESFRSDGIKMGERNFELKQHAGGRWYIDKWERISFDIEDQSRSNLEEIVTVTKVEFDTAAPDDGFFQADFQEGATVTDGPFNMNRVTAEFLIGSLSLPKQRQEASAVTALLDAAQAEGKDRWGPVRTLKINSIEEQKGCLVDFESGRLTDVPEDFHILKDVDVWMEDRGLDGRVETVEKLSGLWTLDTVVIPVSNARFDTMKPAGCHQVLSEVEGVYPPIMSAEGGLPVTYLFQTWDSRGLLQILELNRDTRPYSMTVRYKMIEE